LTITTALRGEEGKRSEKERGERRPDPILLEHLCGDVLWSDGEPAIEVFRAREVIPRERAHGERVEILGEYLHGCGPRVTGQHLGDIHCLQCY
jgi:hypothetical protein